MKIFIILYIDFFFRCFSIKAVHLKTNLNRFSMELPHEITLSEDQKNPGKSKIVFTQDPGSFFYIVNTPPLPQNNKEDFNFEITENSLIIATKVCFLIFL